MGVGGKLVVCYCQAWDIGLVVFSLRPRFLTQNALYEQYIDKRAHVRLHKVRSKHNDPEASRQAAVESLKQHPFSQEILDELSVVSTYWSVAPVPSQLEFLLSDQKRLATLKAWIPNHRFVHAEQFHNTCRGLNVSFQASERVRT